MQFYKLILLFSQIQLVFQHVCPNDWTLVISKRGSVCWALVSVPDFHADYNTAKKVCDAASANVTIVTNSAQRAVVFDLLRKTREPAMVCYESVQSPVEGLYKSVDYERSPEFLRELNEKGMVLLEKKIERNDRISIGFSMKIATLGKDANSKVLDAQIRIGNSSDKEHFSFNLKCVEKKWCHLKHAGTNGEGTIIQKTVLMTVLTTEYFGIIHIDFLEKRVKVLDTELAVPNRYSYLGMDAIYVENVIVSQVVHSKVCQGTDYYSFETVMPERRLPDYHFEKDHVPARRRSLGSNVTLAFPESEYDFFNVNEKNPVLIDVRFSGQTWSYIQAKFLTAEGKEAFLIRFDATGFFLEFENENNVKEKETIQSDIKRNTALGNKIINIRIELAELFMKTSVIVILKHPGVVDSKKTEIEIPTRRIMSMQVETDSGTFYEIQRETKAIRIKSCNLKDYPTSQSFVRYESSCPQKRRILCEKAAEDLPEDVPVEREMKQMWTPKIQVTKLKEKKKRKQNFTKKVKQEVNNLDGFKWSIVSVSAVSMAAFLAVLVFSSI